MLRNPLQVPPRPDGCEENEEPPETQKGLCVLVGADSGVVIFLLLAPSVAPLAGAAKVTNSPEIYSRLLCLDLSD